MCRKAFDLGITHFHLTNDYGPPPGATEEAFGQILRSDLAPYRDEIILSSKTGYRMLDGSCGEWGSRKYLIASCDRLLKRMNLDYADVFYSDSTPTAPTRTRHWKRRWGAQPDRPVGRSMPECPATTAAARARRRRS